MLYYHILEMYTCSSTGKINTTVHHNFLIYISECVLILITPMCGLCMDYADKCVNVYLCMCV